jgi:hypothetical protein
MNKHKNKEKTKNISEVYYSGMILEERLHSKRVCTTWYHPSH